MTARFVYYAAVTLVVAAIVHLAVVLLIPSFAARDAWAKLTNDRRATGPRTTIAGTGSGTGMWSFRIVANAGDMNTVLPALDPAFSVAACLFDLSEGALRIEADGKLPFWSVAVFDRFGRNIYSLNDRTAIEGQLLLALVNPIQRAELRKNPDPDLEEAVLIEAPASEGFVLLRALQPDESWKPEIDAFLKSARCERFEVLGPTETS